MNMVSSIRPSIGIAICILFCSPALTYGKNSGKSEVLNYLSNQSNFVHYSLFSGQPAPTKVLRSILDRQARWDDSGLGGLNPSGLRLNFEKIDQQVAPDGRISERYRVFAGGAPENKVFAFQSWRVDNSLNTDPHDIYVNSQGLLMIHKPEPEQDLSLKAVGDELEISVVADPAEPVRFVLAGRDGATRIYGTLVPHRVMTDDQGCRLEVRVAQDGIKTVLVIADGFPAKSKIPLVSQSAGAENTEVLEMNADGHAIMAAFPYMNGSTQGIFKASAEGPTCLPSVALPWSAATPAVKAP